MSAATKATKERKRRQRARFDRRVEHRAKSSRLRAHHRCAGTTCTWEPKRLRRASRSDDGRTKP